MVLVEDMMSSPLDEEKEGKYRCLQNKNNAMHYQQERIDLGRGHATPVHSQDSE